MSVEMEKEPRAASTDSASKMPEKADRATCASPVAEHNTGASTKASSADEIDFDWGLGNQWAGLTEPNMQQSKGFSHTPIGGAAPGFGKGFHNNSKSNKGPSKGEQRSTKGNRSLKGALGTTAVDPLATVIHHHPPKDQIRNVGYPVNGGQTLLIAYFPWEATEKHVFDEFSKYCNVKKVHLVMDKQNTKPRCFGFVKFWTREDADKALEAAVNGLVTLNDSRNHVWHLKAEWAKSGDMIDDSDKGDKDSSQNNHHGKNYSRDQQKGYGKHYMNRGKDHHMDQMGGPQLLGGHNNFQNNFPISYNNGYPLGHGEFMTNSYGNGVLTNTGGIFSADVSPGSNSSYGHKGAYGHKGDGGPNGGHYGKGAYFQPIVQWDPMMDPMNIHGSPSSDGSTNYMDGGPHYIAQNTVAPGPAPTQNPDSPSAIVTSGTQPDSQGSGTNGSNGTSVNGSTSQGNPTTGNPNQGNQGNPNQGNPQTPVEVAHQLAVMQQIAALSQHLPPNIGQLFQQSAADGSQIVIKGGENFYPTQQNGPFYQYATPMSTFQPVNPNVFQQSNLVSHTLPLDVTPSPSPVGTSSGVFSGGGSHPTPKSVTGTSGGGPKIDYYGNGNAQQVGTMPSAVIHEKFVGTLAGTLTGQKIYSAPYPANKNNNEVIGNVNSGPNYMLYRREGGGTGNEGHSDE